jgi:4-amino-4-deoxy-L-arabinose transferase-like glycosyltransferase
MTVREGLSRLGSVGRPERLYGWALAGLFVVALAVVFATFRDYGVTWDEHYHNTYGKYLLAYYLSGFRDTAALTYHNLWLYGGAFDAPTALAKRLLPFGDFETQHLMIALAGLVGVAGCARIATALGSARAGFWAAVLLLMTPLWYGHMFNNPKDIPFAAAMTWALYYMVRAAPLLPNVPASLVARLGIALGLAFGVRIAAVFALIYLAGTGVAWFAWRWRESGAAPALDLRSALWRVVLPAGVLAYAVMLAAWPWAQHSPLLRPFEATWIFSHSPWDIDTLFEGRLVNSLHLPADYMAVYFAIKTPEIVLVLLALAAPLGLAALRRAEPRPQWQTFGGFFALGFALLFPFVFFVVFRPVAYDCIRHFLFVFPVMAAIAGLAFDRILTGIQMQRPALRGAFVAIVLGYLGWHGARMAALHPDQYVYYNTLVGGVQGAQNRFELDYWGNSYREAVQDLSRFVHDEERRTGVRRTYEVMVCAEGTSASYFFPKDLVLAKDPREADFYLSVTRLGCDKEYDGDTIITVSRDDAVLSLVKDRRHLRATAPERLEEHRVPGAMVAAEHPGLMPPTP